MTISAKRLAGGRNTRAGNTMKASTPGVEQRGYAAGEGRLRTTTLNVIQITTTWALASKGRTTTIALGQTELYNGEANWSKAPQM